MACQDRSHSVVSQALGTSATAAAARAGVTGGRSVARAASPTPSTYRKPITSATSSRPGPRFGASQYMVAST